jgi:hypothetical protein
MPQPDILKLVDDINASAVESETIHDLIDKALIPQGIEIPKPETIFDMDGVPVFTKKSISTLIGKAKSGKTTCVAWIVAKIINLELECLWIDTEQGLYYGSRTQHWVLSIAGLTTSPHLKFYDLKIHNPNLRGEIVEELIKTLNPDIVIIDGIRDLVFDINEPKEATLMSGNLMKWADLYNCHILSILHQNKGNDHARGHLGSEMINKSEAVIKVSQDEKKITICEPEFTRGEPFPMFAFDRDANGMPVLINYVPNTGGGKSNNKRLLPIDVPRETHMECLKMAFVNPSLNYSDLLSGVSAAFEYFGTAMGIGKTKSFIAFYIQQKYIVLSEKVGTKSFYKMIEPLEDNPF